MPAAPVDLDMHAIDQRCAKWLDTLGVLNDESRRALLAIQPAKLACYAFPRAVSSERLELMTDLIAWMFLFDDAFADGPYRRDSLALAREHARYTSLLSRQPRALEQAVSPWYAALEVILGRFDATAPEPWTTRLRASLVHYFSGCEEETLVRQERRWPSVQEYFEYRGGSIGVHPMLDLIEFSTATYLDSEDLAVPAVVPARRFAALALAATNDIFSSKKEAGEDDSFNLVAVLERERCVGRPEALRLARELVSQLQARFELTVRRITASRRSPSLDGFATGVRDWFAGNVEWSSECPRYNSRELDNADARAAALASPPL